MKFFHPTCFLLLSSILLFSCGGKEVVYDNACGPLKEYTVDKAYCEKYGLREANFSLQYPADLGLETPEDYASSNYVSFFKMDDDSMVIESMNIGFYYGLSESGGDGFFGNLLGVTKESLLGSLVEQFKAQGLPIENVTMQDEKINGEDHFTTRGTLETTEDVAGFLGNYLIQVVMVATSSDSGILLIMSAREDSGVTEFKEFETKGCMAPILTSVDS